MGQNGPDRTSVSVRMRTKEKLEELRDMDSQTSIDGVINNLIRDRQELMILRQASDWDFDNYEGGGKEKFREILEQALENMDEQSET